MKIAGIIPARYASRRFPGKPLTLIEGKPMIEWVWRRSLLCPDLNAVIIATDDDRIADAARAFGAEVVLTSASHPSGTDRCAEAALLLNDFEGIINIQGDEPRIHPEQITQVASLLKEGAEIATLYRKKTCAIQYRDPNVVKVVVNQQEKAMYFSRSSIPFSTENAFLQHVGIYGFQFETLQRISQLSPTPLEQTEQLEQLRWLDHGFTIQMAETEYESIAIDTVEDLNKL